MGKVYKARQIDADREVALKLLKEIHDVENKERFFREFKILSELQHQHIMTVYGLALYADSVPYAVCELLDGKSLRQLLLERGHLSWQEVVEIALQVASALSFAHKSSVIHRDLKPENIILVNKPRENYVKIIDFGLSKVLDTSDEKLTSTGQLLGSPMYMSPEQLTQVADSRSDIYSLGCIIFEMLAGENLFPSDVPVAALYRHTTDRATERVSAIKDEVPEDLIRLVLGMLAKDPAQRIQTADDVFLRLDQILQKPGKFMRSRSILSSDKGKSWRLRLVAGLALIVIIGFAVDSARKRELLKETAPILKQAVAKQLGEIVRIRSKFHTALVLSSSRSGQKPLSETEGSEGRKCISWLKKLENEAKTRSDKFNVYWLEAQFYGDLQEHGAKLLALQKCLSLLTSDNRKRYEETPSIFALIASTCRYGFDKEHEKALQYCKMAIEAGSENSRWVAAGHQLDRLCTLRDGPPVGDDNHVHALLAEEYMRLGDYRDAAREAKFVSDLEEAAFPQTYPGNATITNVVMYAEALRMLGRKDEGARHIDRVLARVNKRDELPPRDRVQQRALACDLLRIYSSAIYWFNAHGFQHLTKKYADISMDFAKYYGLKYDPYSKLPPSDPEYDNSSH